jgi:DNA-binding transcriptional regulator LsrR (DeoR family)
MSKQPKDDKLDKIMKRLDIISVILLAQSGLTRTEIAEALGVSEKTIERLIPISKIKAARNRKNRPIVTNVQESAESETNSRK